MDNIITSSQPDKQNPSPATSPSSNGSTTAQTPPLTPRPVSRPDPNPYPTTFVQADTTSFKQVVQMLTGSSKPDPNPVNTSKTSSIPPVKTGQQKKYKLYERRNSLNLKNGLMINPSGSGFNNGHGLSPRVHELLSPSILDFPSLVLSPVTPLVEDPFNKTVCNNNNNININNNDNIINNKLVEEEERVILEKGFYLHPSPRAVTPRGTAEPRLLPLFPVTSPRVSEKSAN